MFSFKTSLVAAVALVAGMSASDVSAQPQDLTIVTGNTGGTFYPVGVGLAKLLTDAGMRSSADIGGGNSNIISISRGAADIGFTFSPTAVFAANAEEPFEESFTNLRGIATLYTNVTQIAVTKDSGITTVAELKGQPFASQPLSAGSATFFRMVLAANDLTEDDLDIVIRGGPAQGAQAVRDRRSVGFQATTGFPNGSFSEAFISVPMTLLTMDDATFNWVNGKNPGLVRAQIPAGTYEGIDAPVNSIGASTILIVNEEMSDDDAYAITKAMIENVDMLASVHGSVRNTTVESMSKVAGIEMHPGAARAFAEAGF
jgi:TRAP transporter TAXI family solute receptor